MLRDVLAPIETLEAEIKKRSLERYAITSTVCVHLSSVIVTAAPVTDCRMVHRLIYEGREKDPAIIKPNGRFYNDPTAFAMHQFLFYMCFKCKKPYFAGGYQCQVCCSMVLRPVATGRMELKVFMTCAGGQCCLRPRGAGVSWLPAPQRG